jgi:adenosylmethionine-8-amino-7-oxononanoate aminotransferase
MRTEELIKYDREHILHGMTVVGKTQGLVVESADGIDLIDTDGRKLMDLSSQLINVNLGHNRRDIIEAAKEQMDKLNFAATLRGFSNLPSIELALKLSAITPKGLDRFMWAHTGADTIDSAFRIANIYWKARGSRKYKIISLFSGYHGTTRGVARATNLAKGITEEMPPAPGHLHIPNYYCYRCPFGKDYPGCGIQCAKFLEYTIINEGVDSVAAFIAEPEQGSIGFIAPPPEYWPMVREICDKYNVLLIDDEVMTGFARTGKMFAIEHWDVVPDMMSMSKGIVNGYLPFGALALTGDIFEALSGNLLPIGSTESGNPVCCAMAMKCIEIYVNERISENAARVGKIARERMENEFMALPHVGTVDGLGLMLAVEIVTDKESKGIPNPRLTDLIQGLGFEQGAMLRVIGNRLGYSPPCTITEEQSERALDVLYSVLEQLKPEDLKP